MIYSSLHVVVKKCLTNELSFFWQQQKKNDGSQPHVEVKDDGSQKEINVEVEKYNIISQVEVEQYNMISNFTQLVAAPTHDDDILRDQDLF